MIQRFKEIAKRHWPRLRLRTILLATLLFVAALPGVGAVFLRVYENTLVRQTESELVAQSAALAAAAEAVWPGRKGASPARLRAQDYRPEPPHIDLKDSRILPERPDPLAVDGSAEPSALGAAAAMRPVLLGTARTTLASIQLLDARGRIVTGSLAGRSYEHLPEVRAALRGRPATVLRHNGAYRPRYPLEWLSRASDIRIHHARPVVVHGTVRGALLLSRSPRALFRGIYEDLGKILVGIAAILATLVVLSGLLSRGIARPIEQLSAATRGVALGRSEVPDPPRTAAVEIQSLYRDFADMSEAIDRRSRYLRDFAHSVSHEFKTPLAAIRGAIEILEDHHGAMREDERRRFLANISADADRLSRLVSRLLDLARADMARPEPKAETDLASAVAAVAAGLERLGLAVERDLPAHLPAAAVPTGTIEAVLVNLIDNAAQAGAGTIRISARKADEHIILDVADDGPGIAPADQARIFEPFFTSRRTSGGTGLGLSIARSLLQASQATIKLAEVRAGTCFRLRLPASSRKPSA